MPISPLDDPDVKIALYEKRLRERLEGEKRHLKERLSGLTRENRGPVEARLAEIEAKLRDLPSQ